MERIRTMIHLIFIAVIIISVPLSESACMLFEFKNKIELEDITPSWLNFSPSDLRVSGDYLYGVDFETFNVYDISNPGKPVWKNSFRNSRIFGLEVTDGYAFVSGIDFIVSLDIDPVETLKELSRIVVPGVHNQMRLSGDYLYVLSDSGHFKNLHIINVSNPSKIVHLSELLLGIDAYSFDVYDEKTLIVAGMNGIEIIDISDPKAPKFAATIDGKTSPNEHSLRCPCDNHSEVVISGGYAYATFGMREMHIFDIEPIETAHFVGCFNFESAAKIAGLNGNTIYAEVRKADENWNLQLVDISDKESPVITRTYIVPDPIPFLSLKENYAYSINPKGGMTVFDLSSDEFQTTLLSACVDMDVLSGHDNFIYAASSKSLMVIDVSNPHKARLINTIEPMEGIKDILFKDDLMILVYERKIQLAETDNKGGVNIVKTIDMNWDYIYSPPIFIGDYLYFISNSKLNVVNVKIPSLAFIEFSFDDFPYKSIGKSGDYLLVSKSGQLDIYTFAEGKKPELVKTLKSESLDYYSSIIIDSNIAYILMGYNGVKIMDMSNPENPFIVAEYKEFETSKALVLKDFIIMDIDFDTWGVWYKEPFKTGKEITLTDKIYMNLDRINSSADDMIVLGGNLYMATHRGLRIFDLSGLSNLPPYSDVP